MEIDVKIRSSMFEKVSADSPCHIRWHVGKSASEDSEPILTMTLIYNQADLYCRHKADQGSHPGTQTIQEGKADQYRPIDAHHHATDPS